jgi:hypothetical protein
VSERYLGVRSATAAISLKVCIFGLSCRKLSGCFSESAALGMMQRQHVVLGSLCLGSMFSGVSANEGDEVIQVDIGFWNNTKDVVKPKIIEKTYGSWD